jgi:hypothetical protein
VHIEYGQTVNDYVFQDASTVEVFQAYVDDTLGRSYKYWTEVSYKGSDRKFKSSEVTTDQTQLIIGVQEVGLLKVNIIAGAINWGVIDSAQVHVRYADSANSVADQEDVVQLTKDARTQLYSRLIFAPVANPYQYMVVYYLKDGQQIQHDWQDSITPQLIINDMFQSRLTVTLLPSGGFDKITQIVVDLNYTDTTHEYNSQAYTVQQTYEFTAQQHDALIWSVPLWEGGPTAFTYRVTIVYADGHSEQQDPQTKQGSMTVVVGEIFEAYLNVTMDTTLVDFTKVSLVQVGLHYTDPANNIDEFEDFVFTAAKKANQAWKLGIKDRTKTQYAYHEKYFLADGTQRTVPDTTGSDDVIVLQVPSQ